MEITFLTESSSQPQAVLSLEIWGMLRSEGAFVVCWTPGLVVLLLDGLNCTQCNVQHVKRWFLLLALLNSVMNPIIYSYKDEDMYSTMRKMICCAPQDGQAERRPSRIPSTIHSRSDTGSQYLEDSINPVCTKNGS
ncbi:lysophosphatidic acid receptor 3-like [Cricetulus griseus]|uniref:lysophosphatidic acid receptor 3-like n=1 Tax=Cricetulus griseus TaxID=10029 RepID=UPI0015C32B9D|nr:lysophosphatidic acid receptor 3-like [Cricetulus griseus]